MTPFDPLALLAMLLAFYPIPSGAALRQARRERPAYFAGGTIIGTHGDALRLPDGRVWDLIFAVEGPYPPRRWQAIDVTDAPPGGAVEFPLEAGPLVPLDDVETFPPFAGESSEALVAAELEALEHADGVLARAGGEVLEFAGARELDEAYERDVAPAILAHEGIRAAFDLDNPGDELEAATGAGNVPPIQEGEYDADEPPDVAEHDPGERPKHGEDGRFPPPI